MHAAFTKSLSEEAFSDNLKAAPIDPTLFATELAVVSLAPEVEHTAAAPPGTCHGRRVHRGRESARVLGVEAG